MSSYARALSVALDETDEEALARFQASLAPIDAEVLDEEGEDGEESETAEDPDVPYVPASDDPIDNPFIT